MTSLVTAARWLLGLFVDDGSLALAILVIVLLSWTFSTLMSDMPLAAGAVLLIGCLCVLFAANDGERRDVRFGSLADIKVDFSDVRFAPESRHSSAKATRLLSANSRPRTQNELLVLLEDLRVTDPQ